MLRLSNNPYQRIRHRFPVCWCAFEPHCVIIRLCSVCSLLYNRNERHYLLNASLDRNLGDVKLEVRTLALSVKFICCRHNAFNDFCNDCFNL